jgi:very-short-patch-repair endonuclease
MPATSTSFARRLRRNMTDAERKLWRALRLRQIHGHKFRRQFPMGTYIVDFVCLEAKLVIEVDGGQHDAQQMHDKTRGTWLRCQGFRILRFWNNEVLGEINAVLSVIDAHLRAAVHPHPNLPPSRGKE